MIEPSIGRDIVAGLDAELRRAFEDEAALSEELDGARSERAALEKELRLAHDEAVRFTQSEAQRQSRLLLDQARDVLRLAEAHSVERLTRSDAEHRDMITRLQHIERLCSELVAATAIDEGQAPTIIIDDRDPAPPRRSGWFSTHRKRRRGLDRRRERYDEALADRINRVMAPSVGAIEANSDEVEARIRNMSHGTNGV